MTIRPNYYIHIIRTILKTIRYKTLAEIANHSLIVINPVYLFTLNKRIGKRNVCFQFESYLQCFLSWELSSILLTLGFMNSCLNFHASAKAICLKFPQITNKDRQVTAAQLWIISWLCNTWICIMQGFQDQGRATITADQTTRWIDLTCEHAVSYSAGVTLFDYHTVKV